MEPDIEIPSPGKNYTKSYVKVSESDIASFRLQEKQRFANPSKPFEYVFCGYSVFVPPIVDIATCGSSRILKNTGSLSVNVQSIVLDSVARCPKGMGNKKLVMDYVFHSNFIDTTSHEVSSAVTSAFNRLSTLKLVEYTGSWLYMLRDKTLEELIGFSTPKPTKKRSAPFPKKFYKSSKFVTSIEKNVSLAKKLKVGHEDEVQENYDGRSKLCSSKRKLFCEILRSDRSQAKSKDGEEGHHIHLEGVQRLATDEIKEDLPEPPVNLEHTPEPPVNLEHTPEPPANLEHTPEPPANLEHTPEPPVNLEHTPEPPANLEHTPEPIIRFPNTSNQIYAGLSSASNECLFECVNCHLFCTAEQIISLSTTDLCKRCEKKMYKKSSRKGWSTCFEEIKKAVREEEEKRQTKFPLFNNQHVFVLQFDYMYSNTLVGLIQHAYSKLCALVILADLSKFPKLSKASKKIKKEVKHHAQLNGIHVASVIGDLAFRPLFEKSDFADVLHLIDLLFEHQFKGKLLDFKDFYFLLDAEILEEEFGTGYFSTGGMSAFDGVEKLLKVVDSDAVTKYFELPKVADLNLRSTLIEKQKRVFELLCHIVKKSCSEDIFTSADYDIYQELVGLFANFSYKLKDKTSNTKNAGLYIQRYFSSIVEFYQKYGSFRYSSLTSFNVEELICRIKKKSFAESVYLSNKTLTLQEQLQIKLGAKDTSRLVKVVPFHVLHSLDNLESSAS